MAGAGLVGSVGFVPVGTGGGAPACWGRLIAGDTLPVPYELGAPDPKADEPYDELPPPYVLLLLLYVLLELYELYLRDIFCKNKSRENGTNEHESPIPVIHKSSMQTNQRLSLYLHKKLLSVFFLS